MKCYQNQIKGFRIFLAMSIFLMLTPAAGVRAAISLEQTVSGSTGSGSAASITLPSWSPGSDELVLVSVAVRHPDRKVSVSGNGLTFVQIADVDNVQGQTGIHLFRAMGVAPLSGSITVSFRDAENNPISEYAAASASRFRGVDSGGTNGSDAVEATATDPGPVSDNTKMKVAITTASDHAWLYAAGTYRTKTFMNGNLPAGQIVILKDLVGGDSGNKASLATWYAADLGAGTGVTMGADNSISGATDWAIVAASIKEGSGGGGGGESLSATPASLDLFVGGSKNTIVSGGSPGYTASSANPGIATASVNDNTVIISGVAVGTTSITISDSLGSSIDVAVNVSQTLAADPATLSMAPAEQKSFMIGGGVPGYTVSSGNTAIATITVSGTTVTVTAVAGGTTAINVVDSVGSSIQVPVYVGTIADPGLPECPVPPFATAGVGPNVLMVLDNSGSMGDGPGSKWENAKAALKAIVLANPNIRFGLMRLDRLDGHYSGKLLVPCGFKGYFTSSADYIAYVIDTLMAGQPNPESQTNLAQTLASAGQYFATVELEDGTRRGMRVGDSADNTAPLDFGYYKQDNNYTYVIDGVTYDAATTDDWGNTIDTTSPIKYACEKSFIIFLTDGESYRDKGWNVVETVIGDYDHDGEEALSPPCSGSEKCDADHDGTSYMDDVAAFLYNSDLRSDIPGKQNIITYTVGFALGHQDETLLRHAAQNGGGLYFPAANSLAELTAVLQAQVGDINAKVSSGTAVATISTSSSTDDYMIRARLFTGTSWKGYLERFTLPYDPDADPPQVPDWEAGELLNSRVASSGYADRKIYTFMSSQFTKKQLFVDTNPLKGYLQVLWGVPDSESQDTINFVRGDTSNDGGKYRDRSGWLLGDIVYSSPVAVGVPKGWYFDNPYKTDPPEYALYQTFKGTNSGRKTMIYVGANDGMLHAFDAANGHEDWAFIPENIQGKLKDLTGSDCHKYYVDLTPYVTDAWDESEAAANKWKTVLIGGNRLGGLEYFALDVTVPTADGFKTMWDVVPFAGENKLSTTMTAVGKVKANGGAVDHWVAIVTSGYQDDTVHTGKIAALKISNGQKASIWDVNGDGLYGPYATTQNKAAGSPYYSLTSPAAIDSDLDGYLDLIYAGDTEGTLWKFFYDFHDDGWKKAALFNTGGQPITATPALAFDADGNLRIYFGTGKYLEENDKADETRNGFYCLVDAKQVTGDANNGHYTGNATILKSDLADLTAAVTKAQFDGDLAADVKANATSNGWYFELDADSPGDPLGRPAERILGKALVVSGVVFFASFVPNQDVCGYGGSARLYAIDYIYGIVDDEPALTEMTTGTRYQDIGAGIPAEPVYYFDPQTKETRLFIQKSDSTVVDPTPVLKERPMQVQSWKAR